MVVFAVCQIISTLITVVVLPLQVRLLIVLLSKQGREGLNRSFRVFEANTIALNIMYGIFKLAIHDPAYYGWASDFFMEIGWIAYADFMVAAMFPFATTFFQFLVGANQLTAVAFPFTHQEIWKYNHLLASCVCTWILAGLVAIPTIYMEPRMAILDGNASVMWNVESIIFIPNEYDAYEKLLLIYFAVHHFILLLTIFSYGFIIRTVRQSSRIAGVRKGDNIPHNLRQCVKVAAVITLCSLATSAFLIIPLANEVYDTAVLTSVYSLKSVITPLAMMALFPKIRRMVLGQKQLPVKPN